MDKVVNIAFNSETGDHGILGLKIDFGTYRNNGLYGYTNILFSQALHVNVNDLGHFDARKLSS